MDKFRCSICANDISSYSTECNKCYPISRVGYETYTLSVNAEGDNEALSVNDQGCITTCTSSSNVSIKYINFDAYPFEPFLPEGVKELEKILSLQKNNFKNKYEAALYESTCQHQWKKYEGFTEIYDYCEKCDLKRR